MASAYAGLVSVWNLIDQVQQHHSRVPTFQDGQCSLIKSLQEKVCFLVNFLERYSYGDEKEGEDLVRRIADATHAAEDIIESHVIGDNVGHDKFRNLSDGLCKVIEEMESIEKKVDIMIEKSKPDDQQLRDMDASDTSSGSKPSQEETTMVGFGRDFGEIVNKLMQKQPNRQVIAITGMGGIGKTTLAKAAYDDPLIGNHFDIRGWIVISQEYNVKEMLLGLLRDINGGVDSQRELKDSDYHQVGEKVWKHLWKRRYLIIMDDVWSLEASDKLKLFFPDNRNGSRIVLTTRSSAVADSFGSSSPHKLKLLDVDHSWHLLCTKVFGKGSCPPELEKYGKKIAKNCKGLPLSITVVGGLLAKSKATREYWENIARDISATVNSEDDERCVKILSLSYRSLPIYLKPCFLYMCIFPEDHKIRVSDIIRLWTAEGFLKPSMTKRFEEIAKDYLKELVDRNLLVDISQKPWGTQNIYKIHDLLRDFCSREAEKERFCYAANLLESQVSKGIISPRRVAVRRREKNEDYSFQYSSLKTACYVRSLTCDGKLSKLKLRNHKLLRVLNALRGYSSDVVFKLYNMRYICVTMVCSYRFPSDMFMLWNLQTLIVRGNRTFLAPSALWEMPQLRHVMIKPLIVLPISQGHGIEGKDEVVLHNLQTLKKVKNFQCTEEITRKIPNIRKLQIYYYGDLYEGLSHYHLDNLGRLHTLQSLCCSFWTRIRPTRTAFQENLEFPISLKKLELSYCYLDWKDIAAKIGCLPHLEVLYLSHSFTGEKWRPIDDQFSSLKVLRIWDCDLVYWRADSTHFPQLEYLGLYGMKKLKKIPSEIGEIPTMKIIELVESGDSVVRSAKKIIKEQHNFGNGDIRLLVDRKIYTVDEEDYDDDDVEETEDDHSDDDDTDDEDEEDDEEETDDDEEDEEESQDEEMVDQEKVPEKEKKKKKKKKMEEEKMIYEEVREKKNKSLMMMKVLDAEKMRGRGARESLDLSLDLL